MAESEREMEAMPVGSVTFLFTDIVGSTRQWELASEAMRVALAIHDGLLRKAIGSRNGFVFKTVGDAFCAAFQSADDAVRAAIEAQSMLDSQDWPEGTKVEARMAIHTGIAERRDADYFGQPLNRTARLLSAGHGGQVLLSLATFELVRDALRSEFEFTDLGEWRLKDLIRPERIFQASWPDGFRSYPPLRTLDVRNHNLPIQLTSFVGREQQIREVETMISTSRIVTLTGSGGAGKTRLALQVSAELVDDFDDGVWFVELAAMTEGRQIPSAVAQASGVREKAGESILESLQQTFSDQKCLLILDNCEHLIGDCAEFVEAIVKTCPFVRVLSTSRESLSISGEQIFRVPSMSLPNEANTSQFAMRPDSLSQFEAVRLFIDRALLSDPSFKVDNRNAPALAELCVRLDGIPLALELAAARCHSLSVEEINERLHDRFRLLAGGSRTAVPRQKTLRALVDWSYDLLDSEEKSVLSRLSVFANTFTLEMAERVLPGSQEPGIQVFERLTSLVDKSLVISESHAQGNRFRLLQTVKQYAADRLKESPDYIGLVERHCIAYLQLVEAIKVELHGSQQLMWLDVLDREHDNIRSALAHCWEIGDKDLRGHRALADIYFYWWLRGFWSEAATWFDRFLALPLEEPDGLARGHVHNSAGSIALYQGNYESASEHYRLPLEIYKREGSEEDIASSLHNVAHVLHLEGDVEAAKPIYEKGLEIRRSIGEPRPITQTLNNLANVLQELKDYSGAKILHEENLAIRRSLQSPQGIAQTLQNLGCLELAQDHLEAARPYFEEAIRIFVELRDSRSISQSLSSFAEIASKTSKEELAARLWGAAEALRESIGAPLYEIEKQEQEAQYEYARSRIGAEKFERTWQEGKFLPIDLVVEFALDQA